MKMPRRAAVAVFTLALALAVGGCATKRTLQWKHPSADKERFQLDSIECRSRARNLAEKDYQFREVERPRAGIDLYGRLEGDVSRFKAKKDHRAYFESCMKYKGYRPAKPAPAASKKT